MCDGAPAVDVFTTNTGCIARTVGSNVMVLTQTHSTSQVYKSKCSVSLYHLLILYLLFMYRLIDIANSRHDLPYIRFASVAGLETLC